MYWLAELPKPGLIESTSSCVSQAYFFSIDLTLVGPSLITAVWLVARDKFLLHKQQQ